ncbi:MAG: ABC-2 transporter permease [Coprobacillaceae bacterium]
MIVVTTISYDEFDNGYPFLFSLPITRKQYVMEKYIFGCLSIFIALIISVIIPIVMKLFIESNSEVKDIVMIAAMFLPIILIMLSFTLPLRLKLGNEKGRYSVFIITAAILLLVFGGLELLSYLNVDVTTVITKIVNLGTNTILIYLCLLSVILLGISYFVSYLIMEKKEF